jgi:thiol-disulfide isomerase/thioredoxin
MKKSSLILIIVLVAIGGFFFYRYNVAHDVKLSGIQVIKNGEATALEKKVTLPAIVHFYAAWCGPCMKEMPEIISFAEGNKGRFNVVFVTDDTPEIIEITALRFNTTTERFFQTPSLKENNIYSIPVTYFTNTKGEIAHSILGECEWTNPSFIKEVEQYLNQ